MKSFVLIKNLKFFLFIQVNVIVLGFLNYNMLQEVFSVYTDKNVLLCTSILLILFYSFQKDVILVYRKCKKSPIFSAL